MIMTTKMTLTALTLAAAALTLTTLLAHSTASAANQANQGGLNKHATAQVAPHSAAVRPAVSQRTGTQTIGSRQGIKVKPNLNESDCRLHGGTVVTPGDNRCGAVGDTFCRFGNGDGQCIDHQ
jgi:hypothetical protein